MRRATSSALVVLGLALGAPVLARCSFGINPDEGHFACLTAADCTSGQECVLQLDAGNGLCYPADECVPGNQQPCGPGAVCVDAGCIDCTGCAALACAGASCVLDGGPQQCVLRVVLADGGLVDAGTDGGPFDGGTDGGLVDAGTTYVCGFP